MFDENKIEVSRRVKGSIIPGRKKKVKKKVVSKKALDLCDRAVYTIISTGIEGVKNLNCTFVANECGTSTSYLSRIFKEVTGFPLKTFIKYEKLTNFFRLKVMRKNITISEAAEILGFCDVDYFIKSFKDHFGTSPRRYLNFLKK